MASVDSNMEESQEIKLEQQRFLQIKNRDKDNDFKEDQSRTDEVSKLIHGNRQKLKKWIE